MFTPSFSPSFFATALALALPLQVLAEETSVSSNAVQKGKQVILSCNNREVLRYQAEPGDFPRPGIKESFRRGGYLHPIQTPAGRVVTDDYPSNHIHHHGIWMPWTKTEFEGRSPDFWNMGDDKGRVEKVNLVVATGHNNLAMNRAVKAVAEKYVKASQLQEGMLNRVEAAIRCYDPCLSCSTHAVGQMPMRVELIEPGGRVIRTLTREMR